MKIKLLIFAMLFGLSASAQFTNFNPYGVQKANAGDSVRLVGSSSGQYLNLPTTKMLRGNSKTYSSGYGMSLVGQQFRVDSTIIAAKSFVNNSIVANTYEAGSYNKNDLIAFAGDSRYAENGASPATTVSILKSGISIPAFSGSCITPGFGLPVATLDMVGPIIAINPKVVIINGGINDLFNNVPLGKIGDVWNPSIPTFCGAYSKMLKDLVAGLPNAKILTKTPIYGNSSFTNDTEIYLRFKEMSDLIIKMSNAAGVPCFDAFRLSGIGVDNYQTKTRDGVHPIASVYIEIGRQDAYFIQHSFGSTTYDLDAILKNGNQSLTDISIGNLAITKSTYPSILLTNSSTSKAWGYYISDVDNSLRISENNIGDHLIIKTGGNIGIGGVENPTEQLVINGKALVFEAPTDSTGVARKKELDLKADISSLSAYQTKANLSGTIAPSTTLYPSNTAVINYLTANYARQGGNSFSTPMVIGTNDANDVSIVRNGFETLKLSTTATFNVPIIATATAYKESGFINTVQSNTLTANVNTYLPADGGTLTTTAFTGTKQVKTASGTGAATTISIAHGMTGVTSSSWVSAIANNAASAGIQYVTVDATNINIIYTVAPASGTNNLLYSIEIKP